MLLRASARANDEAIDLQAVMDTTQETQIPAGAVLSEFTEAIVRRDPALAQIRDRVVSTIGADAMVDAAAVVANFQRMVRIADGLGIPIDDSWRDYSASMRESLGVGAFMSAANTPSD